MVIWTDDLSKLFDEHLTDDYNDPVYGVCTYFWGDERGVHVNPFGYIAIRVPGATRANIRINKCGIITRLVFFDDVCFKPDIGCYKESVRQLTNKLIGRKFKLPLIPGR